MEAEVRRLALALLIGGDEASNNLAVDRAWQSICQYTLDRAEDDALSGGLTERLAGCCAELAEGYLRSAETVEKETVGTWSRTYRTAEARTGAVIQRWLGGSGLLYRGYDRC